MRCPTCAHDDDHVVDSRPAPDATSIRRRRECRSCGHRFTTHERIERPPLMVQKRSGVLRPFLAEKVERGMDRAVGGRLSADELHVEAAAVEQLLLDQGETVVTSEQVGLSVLARLRLLDDVAYVRFASVYKNFTDADDFEQELDELRKDEPPKQRPLEA